MQETTPIACTLTAADLADRQQAWLKVGTFATHASEVPGGLAFAFRAVPGVDESLHELVQLEAECCEWMTFGLDRSPDTVTMTITGVGEDGERGVRESFEPLVSAVARATR